MTVTINGTTGIDKVQAGAIEKSDLPAGVMLNVTSTLIDATSTTTNNTYIATNIEHTISPSATSSKVLVDIGIWHSAAKANWTTFRLYRGIGGTFTEITAANSTVSMPVYGTDSSGFITSGYRQSDTHEENVLEYGRGIYLDSPNTTSPVTYKLYWRVRNGGTGYLNRAITASGDHLSHAPSTVTLTEISG